MVLLLVACKSGNRPTTDMMSPDLSVSMPMDGGGSDSSADLASGDLAGADLRPGPADLAEADAKPLPYDAGVPNVYTGDECMYETNVNSCAGGQPPYLYNCPGLTMGPESGCERPQMGSGKTTRWCCPDPLCVRFVINDISCLMTTGGPPHAYQCAPSAVGISYCTAVGSGGGPDYCCPF
jgi:hypothetical protein